MISIQNWTLLFTFHLKCKIDVVHTQVVPIEQMLIDNSAKEKRF